MVVAGRQARIYVFFDGHAANTALGPHGREQFSTVVLGRATTRTWDLLAPQIDTTPKIRTHPGRVHVVQGFTAHPTQVLLMTDAEAAAWVAATAAEES
ncbi:hypothetical protein ACPCUV_37225 [Streptomyces platensis]|uniref:hypothetical protein n=1 Tax=Streptomyces platensis TaxID=58346 RepID=UPI003C2D27C5